MLFVTYIIPKIVFAAFQCYVYNLGWGIQKTEAQNFFAASCTPTQTRDSLQSCVQWALKCVKRSKQIFLFVWHSECSTDQHKGGKGWRPPVTPNPLSSLSSVCSQHSEFGALWGEFGALGGTQLSVRWVWSSGRCDWSSVGHTAISEVGLELWEAHSSLWGGFGALWGGFGALLGTQLLPRHARTRSGQPEHWNVTHRGTEIAL